MRKVKTGSQRTALVALEAAVKHEWVSRVLVWSAAIVVLASTCALAQTTSETRAEVRTRAWGTTESPGADGIQFKTSAGILDAVAASSGSQYGTGGVALRNRGAGSIHISGVVTPVQAAIIYWSAITQGPAPAADKSIKIQRLFPTPPSSVTTISGTLLGTGSSPCWPQGNTISVFKGTVPTSVATGNGVYQVTLLSGASGSTAGGDPWVGTQKAPLFEGASLVIVGTGPSGSVVNIFDNGLSGQTFQGNPGISYTLNLTVAATGKLTLFDSIGADGQIGTSRKAVTSVADEVMTINGVTISGPGSAYNDSDWNGSSGLPLPQLWDDTGHDITAATPPGTTTLNINISNGGGTPFDCMTPVANIVEIQ